jgi:hypothetical protein
VGSETGKAGGMKTPERIPNEPRKHFIDSKRGRKNIRTVWTLCGKAARACYVFRLADYVTCDECRAKLATTEVEA